MAASQNTSRQILICESCEGDGTIQNKELEDYHRGEYRYWNTVCEQCKGSGRVVQTITTITELVPYNSAEITLLLLKGE